MLLLLSAHLMIGCASWQPVTVSPTAVAEAHNPDRLRVRRADGSTIVLESPTMVGDTLVGQVGRQPARIALASVTELAVRTVTLGSAVGFALLAAIGYIGALVLSCEIGGCA